jgi:hypothetical protein
MDTHKNARLIPKGREEMVRAVANRGMSKAAAARQFNTTPKTVGNLKRGPHDPSCGPMLFLVSVAQEDRHRIAALWRRSGRRRAGLWSDRSGSDVGGRRIIPGASPCRQLFAQLARAPGLVHSRVPGRPLQGEEFHRHRGVPRRRPGGSLVLCARRIYWLGDQRSRHHRYCAFGAMARQQPLARQTTGGLGRTAGDC